MSILDFIFGDEVIEESEGVTQAEIINFCEEEIKGLKERINELEVQEEVQKFEVEMNSNNISSLRSNMQELFEVLPDNMPETNSWKHDNKYASTYCPKCKALNRSQVPQKSQKSMKFTCDNCNAEYRIYFDKKEIEEVE